MSKRVKYIKENLDLTDRQLADNLGISEEFVVAIRHHNGLRKKKRWTKQGDQWLYENYETASTKELREKFPGVRLQAIRRRANKFGVYKGVYRRSS